MKKAKLERKIIRKPQFSRLFSYICKYAAENQIFLANILVANSYLKIWFRCQQCILVLNECFVFLFFLFYMDLLTDTGWQFFRSPRAVRLASALVLANQLISSAAVVCNFTPVCIAFTGVPTVGWIWGLATGTSCN